MNRIHRPRLLGLSSLLCAALLVAGLTNGARGAFLEEYFNGYGAVTGDLGGKGVAGGGWAGGWVGNSPDYQAGAQLTYTGVGYDNAGNNATGSDGRAHFGGGNTDSISTRSFAVGMDGTIWVSWLTSNEGSSSYAAQFSFDGTFNNYFRILDGVTGNRQGRYNGGTAITPALVDLPAYTNDTTGLFLAKIDMNYSGALDRITVWLNPDLSGGQSTIGLGYVLGDSADVFGATLDAISVSFSRNFGAIDAIRISNNINGFNEVTGYVEPVEVLPAPEPGTALLAGCGVLLMTLRRRRALASPRGH